MPGIAAVLYAPVLAGKLPGVRAIVCGAIPV